jgi:Protein of unknown function (DUF4013)
MNFGRAFSYVTEDSEWLKKVGIAGLLMIIPIIGPMAVIGWALELTRRVINGEPDTLPDWSKFSDYLSKGFQGFVIIFAYALPIILISGCSQGFAVLPSLMKDNQAVETITMVVSIVSICFSCVTFLYELVLAFVLPAALSNFVAAGQLGAAFRFNEIFGLLRAAPGPYFMAFLGYIVSGIIASLGLIACIIGIVFTAAYAYAVNAHLWGQAYNAARAAQGMAGPSAPVAQVM